ncbi:MAG TPA: enolase C-terminal domain-like protein [Chthoniobacter sp.]|jgi:L-alanine-DL-glutamate epimerase-like enolase superfamily enzyme
MQSTAPKIEHLTISAYTVPTETVESDGTYTWDKTTLVLVQAAGGGRTGIGYTYASTSAASVVASTLRDLVIGRSAMDVRAIWDAMCAAVRNLGNTGLCAMAISAVDTALWDLKARLLDLPLVSLLGAAREAMPVYGSGGFCNYSDERLREQLGGWVRNGISMVKMKIGREPGRDLERVAVARQAIGPDAKLFVDANGAYGRKQALAQAEAFAAQNVSWFEEPVSSDDHEGLRLLRDRAPAGMEIAAGEYGYDAGYFRRMIMAGAVDTVQADVTRCRGVTGFLQVAALCDAFYLPLSCHCAPALHLHPACAASRMVHAEYFFDHVRIERMLFDGVPKPENGRLHPDLSLPGNGLIFKEADARSYLVT